MARLIPYALLLTLVAAPSAIAQFSFPLQIGNRWHFMNCGGNVLCEGNDYYATVIKDSAIAGKHYALTQALFPVRFIRQEGRFLYGYDTTETSEFVLCDFSANSGDTISIRANKTKYIVALSNRVFMQTDTTRSYPDRDQGWTVRDSFGVTVQWARFCKDCAKSAIINGTPVTVGVDAEPGTGIPSQLTLAQNYPNPFNPSTLIRFSLTKAAFVELKVFNSLGQCVTTLAAEPMVAGTHSLLWDAVGFSSGDYFCRLTAGSSVHTIVMSLVK